MVWRVREIINKFVGFYNRGGKCLLRSTNWAFKSDSFSIVLNGKTLLPFSKFCYEPHHNDPFRCSVCPPLIVAYHWNISNIINF
jgi:hypothetical protein